MLVEVHSFSKKWIELVFALCAMEWEIFNLQRSCRERLSISYFLRYINGSFNNQAVVYL